MTDTDHANFLRTLSRKMGISFGFSRELHDCADHIDMQAAEIERLREALQPFANAGRLFDTGKYTLNDVEIYMPPAEPNHSINSGDLVRARAALKKEPTDD